MKSLSVWSEVILFGCFLFLSSCSSEGKWIKPDAGASEFDKDYGECTTLASQECEFTEFPEYFVQKNCMNNYRKDCLNSKGWKYRKP